MSKSAEEVQNMSIEELQEYEDQLEAEAQGVVPEDSGDPTPAPPEDKKVVEPEEPAKGDQPAAAGGEDAGADPTPAPAEPEPPKDDSDDLKKHISPPSKWAQHRQEQKRLKQEADELRAKAEKADQLEGEVETLKQQMDWLTQAMKGRGVEIPQDPMEVITDDKIANVREEHGDDLADMLTAMRASAVQQRPAAPTPKEETPPATPAAPEQPPQEPGPDPAILEAIDENNELAYWRQESPKLWEKAVAKDAKLLEDPAYVALSYPERYRKVVEEVKNEVLKSGSAVRKDEDAPPTSLSGTDGVVPAPIENDALAKMEAISDPTKQLEFYNSLPEHIRDQVDQALNI